MTTWSWKCRACGYEFISPIFRFIATCPECQVEYVKLATAHVTRSIGEIPIITLKSENFANEKTRNQILFAIGTNATKFECYTPEFQAYLQRKFSEKISEKSIAIILVEITE
ncbi:MAG: hypothetical protein ACTSSH_01065 [Candidatus Heimdallarchaeota archaeon]